MCRRRWEDIQSKYEKRLLMLPDVSEQKLTAQREMVLARLKARRRKFQSFLVPSLAASAALLVLAVILFWPSSTRLPEPYELSTDSTMEEIFSTALSTEPEAVQPILQLFEEEP